eukprot:2452334-Rhodomonas_salina.1
MAGHGVGIAWDESGCCGTSLSESRHCMPFAAAVFMYPFMVANEHKLRQYWTFRTEKRLVSTEDRKALWNTIHCASATPPRYVSAEHHAAPITVQGIAYRNTLCQYQE